MRSINLRRDVMAAAIGLACLASGCNGTRSAEERRAPTAAEPLPASQAAAASYPLGAWRLVDPAALSPVVLWFSQIVIRHAESRPAVSLNFGYWSSVLEATRSREEAKALAERLAARAAEDPSRFAELARESSEDLPSRDEGGALGGVAASQIDVWPQMLDAIAALRPGQPSRVVETPYGFHVLLRTEAPALETVSGAHIVIGHDAAPWLEYFARGKHPPRTRDEARALAHDVYRQAAAHPETFSDLVQRYSEHSDAIANGDIGEWSTREPCPFPPRLKRLGELAVGRVGEPIETHLGFEIILRTPARPRTSYRAAQVMFRVPSTGDGAPRAPDAAARASALSAALETAARMRLDPASFDALEPGVEQWREGRSDHELSAALASLRPGQLTPKPVETGLGFWLAKRLAPETEIPTPLTAELPEPGELELKQTFGSVSWPAAAAFLKEFAAEAPAELGLDATQGKRLRQLFANHELSHLDPHTAPEDRARLVEDWLSRSRDLLGDSQYERYRALLGRLAAARLLPEPDGVERLGL